MEAILKLGDILALRMYAIRKANKEDPMFMDKIKDYIHSGEIKSAINYCRTVDTPSARMIEKGISLHIIDVCSSDQIGRASCRERV